MLRQAVVCVCVCVCDVYSGLILIGFYGNERANKGLERSVNAAADMVDTVTLIRNQVSTLSCSQLKSHQMYLPTKTQNAIEKRTTVTLLRYCLILLVCYSDFAKVGRNAAELSS